VTIQAKEQRVFNLPDFYIQYSRTAFSDSIQHRFTFHRYNYIGTAIELIVRKPTDFTPYTNLLVKSQLDGDEISIFVKMMTWVDIINGIPYSNHYTNDILQAVQS
jgi:hypothetical protein